MIQTSCIRKECNNVQSTSGYDTRGLPLSGVASIRRGLLLKPCHMLYLIFSTSFTPNKAIQLHSYSLLHKEVLVYVGASMLLLTSVEQIITLLTVPPNLLPLQPTPTISPIRCSQLADNLRSRMLSDNYDNYRLWFHGLRLPNHRP